MNKKERDVLKLEESFKDIVENELVKIQSENKKIEIKDIKLVGRATWKDKINGNDVSDYVFIVEKDIIEIIGENGKERITNQKNYYLGNKCVAGTLGDDELIYSDVFSTSEPDKMKAINELIETTPEEEIENNSLNKLKNKEMAEVLSAYLGRNVAEDEVHKVLENMDNTEIEEVKEEKAKQRDADKTKELSSKQIEKVKVNDIQRIKLNQRVDGIEELGKRLDLDGYSDIYVVYSENVRDIKPGENINNTTYSLVGMKNDGTAKVLSDEFEMDKSVGNNASRMQTKIRADGTATRDNKDSSVFTRKSNGMTIGCENDMGTIRVSLGKKTLQENENTEIELQTFNTGRIPLETKEVFQRNKGIYQIDKVQDEIEYHTEHGCEPKDEKDFDGDENTGTHEHIDIDQYVNEILNYENKDGEEKIKDVFTAKEVKDKLLRELHENGDRFTVEQIVKNVETEMNLDAENLDRTRE